MAERGVQVVIDSAVVEEQAQRVVRASQLAVEERGGRGQLVGQLLGALQGGVDTLERVLHVEFCQPCRDLFGMGHGAVHVGHGLRYVALHHVVHLAGHLPEVVGHGSRIVQHLHQGRVARQAVYVGHDGVKLGHHLFDSRHHGLQFVHGPLVHTSRYGVALGYHLSRIGAEHQEHLHAAHQFGFEFCAGVLGHAHGIVQFNADHHAFAPLVIVAHGAHNAYGVAVGIYRV